MTKEQFKTMPASFQDPARILINYPGFANPNDGANSIVWRGLPPEAARWQLFGADIVNPNHLNNAGAYDDQATANSGGVNAISGSVIGDYHFESNPANISYSNVLSGVSSMKLVPKLPNFVDLNFIGLEAGLGATHRNKNTYINYRYSFVGLLNKLGVDFGGEKIGYHDLTGYTDLINNKKHQLNCFFTVGSSSNQSAEITLPFTVEKQKDVQNVLFKSNLMIAGINYNYFTKRGVLKSTLVFSREATSRNEATYDEFKDLLPFYFADTASNSKSLLSSMISYQWNYRQTAFTVGHRLNILAEQHRLLQDRNETSLYPFLSVDNQFMGLSKGHKISTTIGAACFSRGMFDKVNLELHSQIQYHFSDHHKISAAFRRASFEHFGNPHYLPQNDQRERIISHNIQIGYTISRPNTLFKIDFYRHFLSNLSQYGFSGSGEENVFNLLNGANLGYDIKYKNVWIDQVSLGTGLSQGIEIHFEKKHRWLKKHIYYGLNGSTNDVGMTASSTIVQSKYQYRYSGNFFGGINWDLSSKAKTMELLIGFVFRSRSAQRVQDISQDPDPFNAYKDVETARFRSMLENYQRADLRIVYTVQKNNKKCKHRWSLDIQNVFNVQNQGSINYDFLFRNYNIRNQLGIIPVLSYRIEWPTLNIH